MNSLSKYSCYWFIAQGIILTLFEFQLEFELFYDSQATPPRVVLIIGIALCFLGYLSLSKSKIVSFVSRFLICLYCVFSLIAAYFLLGIGSPRSDMAIWIIGISVFNLICGIIILLSLIAKSD